MVLVLSLMFITLPRVSSGSGVLHFSNNLMINLPSSLDQEVPEVVVSQDGVVYVTWIQDQDSDRMVLFAKSIDGGRSFCCHNRVDDNAADVDQYYPSMAVGPDGSIHVAWSDFRNDADKKFVPGGGIDGINDADVYYSKSVDGGATFSPDVKVNDDVGSHQVTHMHRFIAVDSLGKIHVVWGDDRNGKAEVYYSNSTDGGFSFNPDIMVSDGYDNASHPSLAIDSEGTILVVWVDGRNESAGTRIFLSRSLDGGESFDDGTIIDDSLGSLMQQDPEIATGGDSIGVVWYESPSEKVYFSISSDGGDAFSQPKRLSDNPPSVPERYPSISLDESGYIAVSWSDRRTLDYDIYATDSRDFGATFATDVRVNDDITSNFQYQPSVAVDRNGYVYVVWMDMRNGSEWDIYFARSPVGLADLASTSSDITFSNGDSVPYATEMMINATIWNYGDANASNVRVEIFDGQPGEGELIGADTVAFVGMGGGYGYAETSWLAVEPRFHEICVSIDPSNGITESNETNNIACKTIEVIIPPIPAPPGNLTAELSGQNLCNVTLSWSLSPDDGGSVNMTRYDIYRNENYDIEGRQYTLIGSVPNGTPEYADENAGEGDPDNHFYYVCAIGDMNISSCTSDQAGKFTRPLSQGPNLISIALIQLNESIEYVLQTVEYDKAWSYDSFSGKWWWFMGLKDYRKGLWAVNHTVGLWVNVTKDSNLTLAGVVPTNISISLVVGWNLVGFPSFNPASVSDLYAQPGFTRVEGYDFLPPYFLRVLEGSDELQAGYGYWVRTSEHVVWSVYVQ